MSTLQDLNKGRERMETVKLYRTTPESTKDATLKLIDALAIDLMGYESSVHLFNEEQLAAFRKINQDFDNAAQRYHQQEDFKCEEILMKCEQDLCRFYRNFPKDKKVDLLNNIYDAREDVEKPIGEPEFFEDLEETTESLKAEIEGLVKDKKLNNYYTGNTMNYLKSLYTDNDIFLRRDEIKRVGFLKKVIEWIQNLKKLGIDFGKEISEGAGRTEGSTGYYNRKNYKNAGLEDKEKEVISVIEKLTGKSYIGDWEPELAFLPLILEMSAGYFPSTYSEGGFCYPGSFFLRVSRTGMLNISCQGGKLTWDEHNGYDNHYYPARDISLNS